LNVPALYNFWWRSDCHSNSPFAWIELLKSFLFLFAESAHPCSDRIHRLDWLCGFPSNHCQLCESVRGGGSRLQYGAIGGFSFFRFVGFREFVADQPLQCGMARGKRIAEISEIKSRVFQPIADFGCFQFFRIDAKQKRADRIGQTGGSGVNECKQLAHPLCLFGGYSNQSRENPHRLSQSSNFGIKKIASLNSIFQVRNGLIQRFDIFFRRHKL